MLARRLRSVRPPAGGLVIASGNPASRRRLLKNFAGAPQSRKVVDIGSPARLESQVAELLPSTVLFDFGANPDARTFAIITALSALAKTIAVAERDDDALAVRALKAGASGFGPRSTPPALLRLIEELATMHGDTRHDGRAAGLLTSAQSPRWSRAAPATRRST